MPSKLRTVWTFLVSIKYSALAALAAAALGLLGMGVMGLALYYATSFAMPSSYPNLDTARGDWIWPALIVVGMAWSVAFLSAGGLNRYLASKGVQVLWRRIIYAGVLWLWALVLWAVTLSANR